jgi:hypothetical protein
MGADRLLLVSLGTGSKMVSLEDDDVMDMKALEVGVRGLASLMDDACSLDELLLQWMSSSRTARPTDSEIGDLGGDILGGGDPLLTYLRYDVVFDEAWLRDTLDVQLDAGQLKSIAEMDRPENMDTLVEIGVAAAALIEDEHFGEGFGIGASTMVSSGGT